MGVQLFAPDPIDFFDPLPYGPLEYQGHMAIGAIWFVAAVVAFFATKGSKAHIRAGQICIIGVLLVAVSAIAMLAIEMVPPLALGKCGTSPARAG